MIKPDKHIQESGNPLLKEFPLLMETKPTTPVGDELAEALATVEQLVHRGIDITQGYENWVKVGFALASFGEPGRELFHKISLQHPDYNYQECDTQFTSCIDRYDPGKTTKATFFQICKDAGVDLRFTNLLAMLQQHRFSSSRPVPKPDPVISIEGNVIATPANIITLVGQAKAGKSGIVAGLLAGVLTMSGDCEVDTLGFTVKPNAHERAVIHIDAEQSDYNHYIGMMRVLERSSRPEEPDWFHSYNFKTVDITKRKEMLAAVFQILSERHGGVHLAVVDGGADFVLDTNDLKESNSVVHFFETLATRYGCAIVMVLHFNPGSEKARGHFGSQLERKSESVISVSKEEETEVSTIKGKLLRNSGKVPQLQFIYDAEKGHHVYYGTLEKIDKAVARHNKLKQLAEKVFEGGRKTYAYTKLYQLIMEEEGVKERTAKGRIKDMQEAGFVSRSEGDEQVYSLLHDNAQVGK